MVFGSKDKCFRCGIASPTTGPQTRPGDWLCCGCHGINFAKRSHCYICGKERSLSSQVMVYRPLALSPVPKPQVPVIEVVEEKQVRQCPICYEEAQSYSLLVPCGHQCCVQCAPRLATCYQCRGEITESVRIYEV